MEKQAAYNFKSKDKGAAGEMIFFSNFARKNTKKITENTVNMK